MYFCFLIYYSFCISVVLSLDPEKRFRCDYNYDTETKRWYKLHQIPATWHDAELRCHLEGALLASPLNYKIGQVMQNIIKKAKLKRGVLTGIHAIFSKGDFVTVEGIPLNKISHKWIPGQPDNSNYEEDCIAMGPDGSLADVKCSSPRAYICSRRETKDLYWHFDCGTNDYDYMFDARTSHCYKFHRVPRNWTRGYMTCAAEGGYLAIINSEAEAAVIKDLFSKYAEFSMKENIFKDAAFIGVHDWNENGEWRTIEGQTLHAAGYERFAYGHTKNFTTRQLCGAVWRIGMLNNLWCDTAYPFICEKRPDSLCPRPKGDKEPSRNLYIEVV